MDGGYVGKTPTAFHLPAKPKISIRIELPGYASIDDVQFRDSRAPADAGEGVGWQEVYYYPLVERRN